MQDEEIDKIIVDAANQHHPPYDDTSWKNMEQLLDKHLPQKEGKKRAFLLLLLFLLLGGILLGIFQPWNNGSSQATAINQPKTSGSANQQINTSTKNDHKPTVIQNTAATTEGKNAVPAINEVDPTQESPATNINIVTKENLTTANKINIINKRASTRIKIKKPGVASLTIDNSSVPDKTDESATVVTSNEPNTKDIETTNVEAGKSIVKAEETTDTKTDSISSKENTTKELPVVNNPVPSSPKESKNPSKGFAGNFAITLAGGADLSYITIKHAGKIKPILGVGINYTLGRHISLGAGLNVSKKIYYAAPDQYKFPGGVSYPNLTGINATCKIYEIPLTAYYNFKTIKQHNWFAGLGISSYLMKKESYDYLYVPPTGQPYSYLKTINNKNKHYFSVVTLSGGYRYKLNKHISLNVEPYIKLPVAGVGAGKIKLNSSGILFTAAVQPFTRRKNNGR
jgi:hypothetical protein